jgi:high-affinity nickel-transport protein
VRLEDERSRVRLRRKIVSLYLVLFAANLGAIVWALHLADRRPLLLAAAVLAFGLGLRHALDADHIAAIDNVTRRLMQAGQRPVGVGLFFSLGHASVVVLATVGAGLAAGAFRTQVFALQQVGSVVGTLVSSAFLLIVAAMNIAVLFSIWRALRRTRKADGLEGPAEHDAPPMAAGPLTSMMRPLLSRLSHSWMMFPLGFLFGLGFDTATEVALLGISATQAAKGVSAWVLMVFPALFAAGMALIDTTDGVLMLGVYEWALVKPIRKLYYNLTITLLAVVVAVAIGSIEALGLIRDQLHLAGGGWRLVGGLNDNFNTLGFAIVGLFIAAWIGSVIVYRYQGNAEPNAVQAGGAGQ